MGQILLTDVRRKFLDYFKKNNHKVMTYIMPKKTKLISPTKRYLSIIKKGYKDWKISSKSLKRALGKLDKIYR